MVRLSVRGVSKSFRERRAVNDVSFDVDDGNFCALLGPSGCGKTTILRLIAGLESPDSGDILFDGKSVAALPARERDVGMVFQGFALFPLMTVSQNIAFPLMVRGERDEEVEKRVAYVAQLLRIDGRLKEMPATLSGGEQQRVSLARAIVRQPKLFLMDEPLSSLDAPLRAEMRVELKRLHQKINVTTVYVTHDQAEALALADRVGVMEAGRMLQYETPERIYADPANVFVAHFVGNYSSNLLDVELKSDGGRGQLATGGLRIHIPAEFEKRIRAAAPTSGLVVSIRPEDIEASRDPSDGLLAGRVTLVETLGQYSLMQVSLGEAEFKVVAPAADGYKEGEQVWILLPERKLHVFDRHTGLLIA